MTNTFVEANLPQNSSLRVTQALERLKANIEAKFNVTWNPNAGDLDVILLEVIASLVGNVEITAAIVLSAVLRRYGTKLFQLPYNEGAQATGVTTWTLSGVPATKIPAGTQLEVGEKGFYTAQDVTITEGQTTASVPITAVARGTEYNGVTGVAALTEPFTWVTEVVIAGETTGGAAEETDEEYEGRLTAELELQAPRPITASDYAKMTLGVPSTILPTGVVVGRATSIDGYNPESTSMTATTTNKSATLSEVSSFTGLTVGSILSGTAIPANTTVVSIDVSAKTLVMSAEATAAHSKEAVTAIGSYENGRTVCTWVTDLEGDELTTEAMEAIETWLKGYREINSLPFVRAPLYETVYITYQIQPLPGYGGEALLEQVNSALEKYLSPFLWGNPTAAVNTAGKSPWETTGYEKIRYNVILGIIESVKGVQYVPHGSTGLAIGFEEEPTGTEDLTLGGSPVVLPVVSADTITGSVA